MKTFTFTITALITFLVQFTFAQRPGSLDKTFNNDGRANPNFQDASEQYGRAVAIQLDGKIVVAGYVNIFDGSDFALCRYNPNGTLDPTFGNNGKVTSNFATATQSYSDDKAYAVAIQPDGKILVAGSKNDNTIALARYNTNGSPDNTFNSDGKVLTNLGNDEAAYSIAIQPDGKILIAGVVDIYKDNGNMTLVRYNASGSLDLSFGYNGSVTYGPFIGDAEAYSVALQPDGKILIAGNYIGEFVVLRFNSDGSYDAAFGSGGVTYTSFGGFGTYGFARSVVVLPNKKILAGGYMSDNGNYNFTVVRYKENGTEDSTFGINGKVITDLGRMKDVAFSMAVDAGGNIVLAGKSENNTISDFVLTAYTRDGNYLGSVVTNFSGRSAKAYSVAIQPDGKVVAAGTKFQPNSYERGDQFAVARYYGINAAFQNITSKAYAHKSTFAKPSSILLYPNPAKNILHIQTTGSTSVSLINQFGSTVLAKTITGTSELNVASLLPGVYYVRNDATGETQKVIVNR